MNSPYGQVAFWGFSPSFDLVDYLRKHEVDEHDEYNVLMIGSADGRHILQTLSNLCIHRSRVNIYVEESNLENIARQVLLMNLALESSEDLNLQEKAEIYLELLGNTLIRSDTEKYLIQRSNEFIKMITDPGYAEKQFPLFDFTNLKFKERDQLEGIFKFWRNDDQKVFNVMNLWENRVRHFLGTRYDTRENAFDWEYSMNLKEKASIVNWREYKKWREMGIGFEIRDESAYEIPNKTLASGLIFKKNGERIPKRGYWGDIINSPYITFGIKSENEKLFKKNNNVHIKTSTDVSLFNVTLFLHQLMTGEKYELYGDDETVTIKEVDKTVDELPKDFVKETTERCKIVFLPMESVNSLHKKSKYKRHFDLIFFSNSMVHYLDNSITELFRDNHSILVIESTKFMLDLKSEMHEEYGKKIKGLAGSAKCESCKSFDGEKHEFAVFKYQGE